MSTNVYKTLAAALAEIHRLRKGDDNKHGGYKYVSVDDVKDHVRPILAKHGFSISVSEQQFDLDQVAGKNGMTTVAVIRYAISLQHSDGGVLPPDIITVCLPYTGAQTAGAARSYAVKEWSKSTLLVSTGERDVIEGGADADAYKQQEYVSTEKSAYQARKDGDDASYRKISDGLAVIERSGSLEDLKLFWKNSQPALKKMKASWVMDLEAEKNRLKEAFERGHAKPVGAHVADQYDEQTGEVLE